jgi:hypothetical protein
MYKMSVLVIICINSVQYVTLYNYKRLRTRDKYVKTVCYYCIQLSAITVYSLYTACTVYSHAAGEHKAARTHPYPVYYRTKHNGLALTWKEREEQLNTKFTNSANLKQDQMRLYVLRTLKPRT